MELINEKARIEAESIDLEVLDVSDRARFRNDTVRYYFDRLRKEDPVHFCRNSEYGQYWSITKYADIQSVESNHELYSSASGYSIYDQPELNKMFLAMDPPEHKNQRSPIMPLFSMSGLQKMEPTIRETISDICDTVPLNKVFDWVEIVSSEVTNKVLAITLDVPKSDHKSLLKWSEVLTILPEKESRVNTNNLQLMVDFAEYFNLLWDDKMGAKPSHDLVSMYAHSPIAGRMRASNFIETLSLLIAATTDTTKNSMTGGINFLSKNPKEREFLYSYPGGLKSAVSEIIRYQTPVAHMRRTATADTILRGKKIRKGDKIILWYISANRDEDEIEEPYKFCVSRKNHEHHISFGYGVHRCIGKNLAELQLKILLEELIARRWYVEPIDEPVRVNSCFINGYESMPVIVTR